jgi:endoglucanase
MRPIRVLFATVLVACATTAFASTLRSTTNADAAGPNALGGAKLYVEPNSSAAQTQHEWESAGRSADAAQIAKIASRPAARWFGEWSTAAEVSAWVGAAAAAGATPVLVAYDLPWRDCGLQSAGGAKNGKAYKHFIAEMAKGIGARRAAVIVEPDALAELDCLKPARQKTYLRLLKYAVSQLGAGAATSVYLDAGNAGWQPAATIASRLSSAGVANARGFALNVSNFDTTASERSYGEAIVAALGGGAHFVIDTSRNGRGKAPDGAWCNPPGRGLGSAPSTQTGIAAIDALLWIKQPGQSDGNCNGGPSAGTWWPNYGLELARNSAG